MGIVAKRLAQGTLSNTKATLYTVPSAAGSYTVIKAMALCNKTDTAATVTVLLNGTTVVGGYSIAAHESLTVPYMDQIIHAGELIEGISGTSSAIDYYITGKEATP